MMPSPESSISRNNSRHQVEPQVNYHSVMSTLAERLKEAREDKGWNKAELGRRAKVSSPSTITELEQGKRTESPQLGKIADVLGVEIMWLQFGRGPKHIDRKQENYTDEDVRIARLVNTLSPARKATAEQTIVALMALEQAEENAMAMQQLSQRQAQG
jgi:transcriptional regulator with XRE-family HTH domain